MIRTYPVGETITATTTFMDPNTNQPRSPSSVIFRVLDPAGVETRPMVINPQPGVFTAKFTPAIPGRHNCRWEGSTGTIMSAVEQQLEVTPSAFS